jgi:DNA-binding response OmpR family regulator
MATRKNILIVDDDQEVIDLLKDYLEVNEFDTSSFTDGLEALDYLKDAQPDLVITDLLLPGEHGINVVKTIKQKYFIPVIMMSSIYNEKELKHVIEEYFVEGFFQKPFELNALLRKINSILDAKPV